MIRSLSLAWPKARSTGLLGEAGRPLSAGRVEANDGPAGFVGSFTIGREEEFEDAGEFEVAFLAETGCGLASDAVEERCGTACEDDTTAGSEVALITGLTPFAANRWSLGSEVINAAGVERFRFVGDVFPCWEKGVRELAIALSGRFWTRASVERLPEYLTPG